MKLITNINLILHCRVMVSKYLIFFITTYIACTQGEVNGVDLKISIRDMSGCVDFIWELPCDAKVVIWYNDGKLIPNWRIMATAPEIQNNNNPVWTTPFPIPPDTEEFKLYVYDVDTGLDDLIGVTRAASVLEILDAPNRCLELPLIEYEGSGVAKLCIEI